MTPLAVELPESLKPDFGQRPVLGRHGLKSHDLFTDAALIDLLDHFPRKHLYALSMGSDPRRADENRLALHDNISGSELLRAVKNGRLWLNITRVDLADIRYRRLVDQLYAELSLQVPGFMPDASQATLLISSPHALVYYHADAAASALWHIRGHKRVWVYPALDQRYMTSELLEDLYAGVRHEYLPYETAYDHGATIYDLHPGQWILWPHNAPHRITNLNSVNVSLSTEHFTHDSKRRARLYVANRFFRTRLHCTRLSRREDGLIAAAKIASQRVAFKLGFDPVRIRQFKPVMRIEPDAPGGAVALTDPQASAEMSN